MSNCISVISRKCDSSAVSPRILCSVFLEHSVDGMNWSLLTHFLSRFRCIKMKTKEKSEKQRREQRRALMKRSREKGHDGKEVTAEMIPGKILKSCLSPKQNSSKEDIQMTIEGILDGSQENKSSFSEHKEEFLRKSMPSVSNQTEPVPVRHGRDHFILETVSGLHGRNNSQNHSSVVLYPGLTGICNTFDLARNIFDGEIPIEILDFSSVVLKHQFSVEYGLLLPSRVYAHILENRPLPATDRIPSYYTAVQIHYVQGHYVVSYQFMNSITIYDSLPYIGRLEQVMPQLKILYQSFVENPETPVSYCTPQHQGNSTLCGAFVVAFTVALLLKQAPLQRTNFVSRGMRPHLLNCLKQEHFQFFPSTRNEVQSIENYFLSQTILQAQYEKEKLKESVESSNRVEKHLLKLEKSLKPEQKIERRRKEATLRRMQRKLLCPEKLSTIRAKDSASRRKKREMMSQEKKSTIRAKETAGRRKSRELLPPEKKLEISGKDKAHHQQQRELLSQEKQSAVRRKETAGRRNNRELLPSEKRSVISGKDRVHHQQQRGSLCPEIQSAIREKETAARRKNRELLPPKKKSLISRKNSAYHQQQRESLPPEIQSAIREKETAARRKNRELLPPKKKSLISRKDSAYHQEQRESVPQEIQSAIREKEKAGRRKNRELLPPEMQMATREKEKADRRKKRELLPPEKQSATKEKETAGRRKNRELLPPEMQSATREKEKAVRRKKRELLHPEKKKDNQIKDRQRKHASRHSVDIKEAMNKFLGHIKDFPEYICTSCNRMLYKKSVTQVQAKSFKDVNTELAKACCTGKSSPDGREWICTTCLKYVKRNSLPPQASANNLALPDTPPELSNLTTLEERLLSQRYPFMKLLALPKGRQSGIKGAVVNVPVQAEQVCNVLPKTPNEAGFLPLKLKRKLQYSGHHTFQYIRPNIVKQAFKWLKKNNPLYFNAVERNEWEDVCRQEDETVWTDLTTDDIVNEGQQTRVDDRKPQDNSHDIPVRESHGSSQEQPRSAHGIPDFDREPQDNSHYIPDSVQELQGCNEERTRNSHGIPDSDREPQDSSRDIPDTVPESQDSNQEQPRNAHGIPDSDQEPPDSSDTSPNISEEPQSSQADRPGRDEDIFETEELEGSRDSQLRGIKFDTCIQPDDLSLQANKIISMAPGEGKRPINILTDKNFEEMSFPTLFPSGQFGLTHPRPVSLSAKKYFQRRILESGGKFASNIEYLFVGQFVSEWQQIRNSISVALRKSFSTEEGGEPLTASLFKNPDRIRPLLMKDDAYRFLRPIRGSPPYWQQVMFKLLAAIKQLKIFTWFLTLSAADLRWTDTLQAIARQQGRTLSEEDVEGLSWEDKCNLLRSNPVTAARHFHYKLQCLFTDVILSDAAPLGKVIHYFYRIEFQQRGSPHAHAILWVEGAPQPDAESQVICDFVDKYVQASIPKSDQTLKTLVTELQRHCHSASCRKKGSLCRFNFPRPPTDKTLLSKAEPAENEAALDLVKKRKCALEILAKVMDTIDQINDLTDVTLEVLLSESRVSSEMYYNALSIVAKDPTLHLQREPVEVYINNYNACILLCWKANMDLQFVVSPYAAIHYITSYVTKDEREMGLILQCVSKEMKNLNISKQMNKVADAFASSRNVSAQEAVYRLLGLPLYVSNFKTVWIPTGFPHQRVRILKTQALITAMEDDEPDIFVANLLDRYTARPAVLDSLCLAEFAMWYEVSQNRESDDSADFIPTADTHHETHDLHSNELPHTVVLSKDLGTMKKKVRANVIRFHQCSMTKEPELYFYNKMLLFLPWRNEAPDMLAGYETYCEHYHSEREVIEMKEKMIMTNADIVDEAVEKYQEQGPPTHVWDEIAPETEHTEADAIEEGVQEDTEHSILCPDGQPNLRFTSDPLDTSTQTLAVELIPEFLPEPEYRKLVQSLNLEQRVIFQYLLNWCHAKANSPSKTPAEYIFVTGGAGTGKSHLIKATHNMANFTFRKAGQNPIQIRVLLMAPTGTAAFNIGAPTIHSALLLPKNLKSYIKLSDEKCNTLRVKLQSLQMIIIDEISLVGSDMLVYISKRLQQITGCSQPFGGITVVAFGDLYQLPPVAQPFVYDLPSDSFERLSGSVWQWNFKSIELQQIMRQKEDQAFASLLNRVRKSEHTDEDMKVLQTRAIDPADVNYMSDSLHIFARNVDVDVHNDQMMHSLKRPVISLMAKEKRPACLKSYVTSEDSRYTGGVAKEIFVCEGARVMITRNIDVQDGLVNGAQGTVLGFIPNTTNGENIKAILIQFDKAGVGSSAVAASRFDLSSFPSTAVPITPVEIRFTVSKCKQGLDIAWIQFPLKLAFACTIHKVQGATLDKIVVSFKNRFSSGQAYVALSRARTLEGLQLLDFDSDKIRANIHVQKEMQRILSEMHLPSPYLQLLSPMTSSTVQLALLNANSARLHFSDISSDPVLLYSSVVGITETHFTERKKNDYQLQNFRLYMNEQNTRINNHGIALYVSESFESKLFCVPFTVGIEILCLDIRREPGSSCRVVLLYRSPSVSQVMFLNDLNIVLSYLQKNQMEDSVLMGDFNVDAQNISASSALNRMIETFGWKQMVTVATHRSGSCLDHIYIHQTSYGRVSVLPTYFSDHHFVHIQLLKT